MCSNQKLEIALAFQKHRSMNIDADSYSANLFPYFFESKYIQQFNILRISIAYKFHGASGFMLNFCRTSNNGKVSSSMKHVYPKQLELKLEHQGKHATFLDLDIKIEDKIFGYHLFDKKHKFPLFIVQMRYLSINIPSPIFYGLIFQNS